MDLSDSRIKMMNEVLNGIKVLKMYAWEESFEKQILKIRKDELDNMEAKRQTTVWLHLIWATSPFMISLLSFGAYIYSDSNNTMSADKVFVSLSLFHTLHWSLHCLTHVINNFIQGIVSFKRIQEFLNSEELDTNVTTQNTDTKYGVMVEAGNFSWSKDSEPTLKEINLNIPQGSLVAVVGSVGSGKSSLLSAILGEMQSDTAKVNMKGSVAYVSQQAWIMNATLQNNILFGEVVDKDKYNKIIDSTALRKDLEILEGGDQAEIGEKGINLSGGQKQRVSLARSIYHGADVYLLDDPLSAVDSHVGKHIFDQVIGPNGMIRNTTRILVTHGLSFLKEVDLIITMVDGKIGEIGSFKELLGHDGAFAEFFKTYMTDEFIYEDVQEVSEMIEVENRVILQLSDDGSSGKLKRQLSDITHRRRLESESETSSSGHFFRRSYSVIDKKEKATSGYQVPLSKQIYHQSTDKGIAEDNLFKRQLSTSPCNSHDISEEKGFEHSSVDVTYSQIEVEDTNAGSIKLDVVMMYLKAIGFKLILVVMAMSLVHETIEIYLDVWLKDWTNDATTIDDNAKKLDKNVMRIGVYAFIGIVRGILILSSEVFITYALLKASRILHQNLLRNILRSPMSFFDTTPVGRIVNRFSKDVETIDGELIFQLKDSIICGFCAIGNIFVICSGTPQFIAVIIPITVVYFYIQRLVVSTTRQLRKLLSAARSPIYSHFSESISGSVTIRAFKQQNRFAAESARRCDIANKSYYLIRYVGKWFKLRIDLLSCIIVLCACLLTVFGRETLSPGTIGLVISHSLHVTGCLEWFVRTVTGLETNMVSMERIKEYSESQTEAEWVVECKRPREDWPDKGSVHFDNFSLAYRTGLDLVLKAISFKIEPCEKIGIVGRTGAGKSSLTMGLFRIIEKAEGSIYIDGVNIADIGLHDLRSKITIIPQDPVLFSGTMKMNLDPFSQYSDEQIWKSLRRAHLAGFVNNLKDGLDHKCSEGGENLSVGQRQLVCLSRALLRKTKVLVLDEATAAVDLETDELIQKTIRTEFSDCTVLTIAHRLNTIIDYTRIMVLESGTISELGSPSELLSDTNSVFYGMAKDSGLVTI